jgi:hypothetical protein
MAEARGQEPKILVTRIESFALAWQGFAGKGKGIRRIRNQKMANPYFFQQLVEGNASRKEPR